MNLKKRNEKVRERESEKIHTDFYLIAPICVFMNKQTGMKSGKIDGKISEQVTQ